MATSSEHTGAMIALVPTEDDLDRLVVSGGEPRDELHLTLYYLGDALDYDVATRVALTDTIRRFVLLVTDVVRANAFGVAHWNPTSDDPAWVLNVGDVPIDERHSGSLVEVRSAVLDAILQCGQHVELPPQHSPWQPHICLAYTTEDRRAELEARLGDVTFDRVRVAFGGEVTDVPLGSAATVASTMGGVVVPWHTVHNHSACPAGKPWAVVKDATGDVEGCHASESDANDQLAALYASEDGGGHNMSTDAPCVDCGGGDEHLGSTSSSISDSSWNGAASRFTDEQYQMSAAACDTGDGSAKQRCFLPHHEPGGAVNRNGVHAAAARFNQLKGHSPEAISRARSHLRAHYSQLNEEPPDVLRAEVVDDETFATRLAAGETLLDDGTFARKDTRGDENCGAGFRKLPNGECITQEEYAARSAWYGVLVVEGTPTGDGREFSPDALTWADNALLRWQKEGSHGGSHDVTVSVGRIDEVWRVGNQVMGRGVIDIESPDGLEIARRMGDNFAGGISIDADDIQDADVEFVWSEDPDGAAEDDPLLMLFGRPEKVIYHGGRVRAATICDIPAFVEARVQLGTPPESTEALAASVTVATSPDVVPVHQTATSDDAWDATVTSRRLPNIMTLAQARAAFAYVADLVGDRVARTTCAYLHHEVSETGDVGPANLTACAAAISALRDSELDDRAAIYGHLAQHLRDAGQEPPPLDEDDALTAAIALDAWRPPREWFENPQFSVHTGITVTDDGRVYGHAAPWGECHIGNPGQCITLPHEDNHPYFMTGEVVCADGSRVAVGQVTVGTGHAPLGYRASHAAEHYDNTGAAVADVAVGNDKFGLWIAGAIRPSVAASRVHELRASGRLSGDWRRIGGQLRLVGLLAVNVPGFPLPAPRARVASGAPLALVAAGAGAALGPGNRLTEPSDDDLDRAAMRRVMSMLATRVRRTTSTEEVSDV